MRSTTNKAAEVSAHPTGGNLLATLLTGYWSKARRRAAYRRTVRQLSKLDDRTLKDIGLVRTEIYGVAQEVTAQKD